MRWGLLCGMIFVAFLDPGSQGYFFSRKTLSEVPRLEQAVGCSPPSGSELSWDPILHFQSTHNSHLHNRMTFWLTDHRVLHPSPAITKWSLSVGRNASLRTRTWPLSVWHLSGTLGGGGSVNHGLKDTLDSLHQPPGSFPWIRLCLSCVLF